jgi:hypothetical protein
VWLRGRVKVIGVLGRCWLLALLLPMVRWMIAQDHAVLWFCGNRRRGHSPFKVTAEPQGGAGQARATEPLGAVVLGCLVATAIMSACLEPDKAHQPQAIAVSPSSSQDAGEPRANHVADGGEVSPRSDSGAAGSHDAGVMRDAGSESPIRPETRADAAPPQAAHDAGVHATAKDSATEPDADAGDSALPAPDADAPAAPVLVPRLLQLPPPEAAAAPHRDDCTFDHSPTDLVPTSAFVAPAWEVEVDDDYVYFSARAQVDCVLLPPLGACREQGIVRRMPRCGGVAQDLGTPFYGSTTLRAGGGKLYVRSSQEGLFRVDTRSGAHEKLNLTAALD